jgi:hypothetical protein
VEFGWQISGKVVESLVSDVKSFDGVAGCVSVDYGDILTGEG